IGTGQSSDSLMWGNRGGMLDDLCAFAGDHPNVLLELKTKSARVDYFLERDVPPNVVLSWSLNTPAIIKNEEHFTASLEERLKAARKAADRGIPVAFHFHPMVYYEGWKEEYTGVAGKVLENFAPGEVRFISLGTVTFIKPVLQAIRRGGLPTKMLQMPFQKDPLGKWTYPDRLKEEMFKTLYQALAPWHGKVFIYLCMEKPEIWKKVFGFAYPSHREFENAFALLNPFGLTSPGECHRQGRL
ncbi:MAG: hypothetical protein HY609_05460, partial [Deltaproteobacteria bacterium]|nr:hypothetical protein [Deltaproteobacteria bacterium]